RRSLPPLPRAPDGSSRRVDARRGGLRLRAERDRRRARGAARTDRRADPAVRAADPPGRAGGRRDRPGHPSRVPQSRPPRGGRRSVTLAATLRRPVIARLGAAGLLSEIGDWMLFIALPLFVLSLTGSSFVTATVFALELVPMVLAAPLAGVPADRC